MLKVSKLLKRFKLDVVNPEHADLSRGINKPAIHRMGLELIGSADVSKTHKNVVGWGTKESKFFAASSKEERVIMFERVMNDNTPLILLSSGVAENMCLEIIEHANKYNIPVVQSKQHLSDLTMTLGWYIVKYLAESVDIHGSLVVVNGHGVMIIGKSGIGKSEAVLELIQKGGTFVSDDTVVLKRIGTDFVGGPADLTKDFLEARGIGLIDIPSIYGLKAVRESVNVDLVIELLPSHDLHNVDRLGNENLVYEVLGGTIPKIQIPVENGRTLSALIEAAVNVYIAKEHGMDPLKVISERNK